MKNVLLISSIDWFPTIIKEIETRVPGIKATVNFEEVYGMVKAGEVRSLCIIMGGYNYSKNPCNTISAWEATKEIHKINPNIPILSWNDFKYEENGLNEKIANELYLSSDNTDKGGFFKTIEDFFQQHVQV